MSDRGTAGGYWAMAAAVVTGMAGALWLTPGNGASSAPVDEAALAANSFLSSLPSDLLESTHFPLDSPERHDWHFVPRSRRGASLLQLDDTQAELIGPLLATALSPEGLLTARGVIKHENILREVETARGIDASRRDPGLYHTTVFGKPSGRAPWAWRFEGHHLSLNVTQLPGSPPVVGPVFVGANPARVPAGPQAGFRLLAGEEDLARTLMSQLPEARRQRAMIRDTAFADILTGNDREARLEMQGLPASEMNAAERQALRALLELYATRFVDGTAKDILARIERAGFGKLRFAWAGSIEPGQPHYYRVHGPTLLIEYDNTQNGANHIHTVYRDLERDFGGDVLRAHYLYQTDREYRMAAGAAPR
jgi:hypothetical protein